MTQENLLSSKVIVEKWLQEVKKKKTERDSKDEIRKR